MKKLVREPEASIMNFETTYLTRDGIEIPVNFSASVMEYEKSEKETASPPKPKQ